MKSLENVERVEMPSAAEFSARYLAPPRPVVLTGVHVGSPIAEVDSMAKAIDAFGDLALPVQLEYMTRQQAGRGTGSELWRVGDFLRYDGAGASKVVITEQTTPPEIAALLPAHPYLECGGAEAADAVSKTFIAHAGHFAHLHYDMDGRPVFLTQVFGRKRVLVLPPTQSQALDPITTERGGNMSNLYLENLDEGERLAWARRMDAFDCVLSPGEALFIPTAWWHYVDYVDTGMSYNVRIGRNALQKRLYAVCEVLESRHLHYWQTITQPFATGAQPSAEQCAKAEEVLAALDKADEDITAFGAALVRLYRSIEPGAFSRVLSTNDIARLQPIERLFDASALGIVTAEAPADASDGVTLAWRAEMKVALAPNTVVTRCLSSGDLVILRDNVAVVRVGAESEGLDLLVALVGRVSGAGPASVAEHAKALAVSTNEIAELLEELGDLFIS